MKRCDDCERDKKECTACKARRQAAADRAYDEMRETGARSPWELHMSEEMERRSRIYD